MDEGISPRLTAPGSGRFMTVSFNSHLPEKVKTQAQITADPVQISALRS
jgi:hypothetical protein